MMDNNLMSYFFDLKMTKHGIISTHNRVNSVLVVSFLKLGHVRVLADLLERFKSIESREESEECIYECEIE